MQKLSRSETKVELANAQESATGRTALHFAAHYGKLDVVKYLLDNGFVSLFCEN